MAPLDSSQAVDTGGRPGSVVVRHVVCEALAIGGIIVTRAPWQYPPDSGPVQAV